MRMNFSKLRMKMTNEFARMRKWAGRSDGAPNTDVVEFRDVFEQVIEEGDWVCVSAGALERSWRAPRAKV